MKIFPYFCFSSVFDALRFSFSLTKKIQHTSAARNSIISSSKFLELDGKFREKDVSWAMFSNISWNWELSRLVTQARQWRRPGWLYSFGLFRQKIEKLSAFLLIEILESAQKWRDERNFIFADFNKIILFSWHITFQGKWGGAQLSSSTFNFVAKKKILWNETWQLHSNNDKEAVSFAHFSFFFFESRNVHKYLQIIMKMEAY